MLDHFHLNYSKRIHEYFDPLAQGVGLTAQDVERAWRTFDEGALYRSPTGPFALIKEHMGRTLGKQADALRQAEKASAKSSARDIARQMTRVAWAG